MERNEWVQHCQEVNRLLKQIRDQGVPPFTTAEANHFQEYLDANELGVAFDFLCCKLHEAETPISQAVYDLIVEARSRMGCPSHDWEKLKSSVRRGPIEPARKGFEFNRLT